MSRKQYINGFNRFQPKDNILSGIVKNLEDENAQQDTLEKLLNKEYNYDYRKDLYLWYFEIYITTGLPPKFIKSNEKLSFEMQLRNFFGISTKEFEEFKKDRLFHEEYANLLKAKINNDVNVDIDKIEDPEKRLKAKETGKRLTEENILISNNLPIKEFNAFFWEHCHKTKEIYMTTIKNYLQGSFILKLKEKLDNTKYSDDGAELLINKDYDRSPYVTISHNGLDITNEVTIEIKDELFNHNKKSEIAKYFEDVITREIASGTLAKYIFNEK